MAQIMPFLNSVRSSFGPQGRMKSFNAAKDGLTAATAGDSAYQIKQNTGTTTDGLYWIKNTNINGNSPFQVYCDMNTDGGGWTLLLTVRGDTVGQMGWSGSNILSRNTGSPSLINAYSIIGWGDYIKKSASGWQYMMEAANDSTTRRTWGGIFTSNSEYTISGTSPSQTNVTANQWFNFTRFGGVNDPNNQNGIMQRIPYIGTAYQTYTIYTTFPGSGNWYGTLVTEDAQYNTWKTGPWSDWEATGSPASDPLWKHMWIR